MSFLSGCGYDRFDDYVVSEPENLENNIEIGQLNGLVAGGPIERGYVFKGVVTSSDSAGNFYKQLIVEDGTGAVELRLGVYDIYAVYNRWDSIAVKLYKFSVGQYYNLLQVGFGNKGNEKVNSMESWDLIYGFAIKLPGRNDKIGKPVTLRQIVKSMAGQTIFLDGYFRNGFVGGEFKGKQQFVTNEGIIIVNTSDYALFGKYKLPSGIVRLRAIVMYEGNAVNLKISDSSDVFELNK